MVLAGIQLDRRRKYAIVIFTLLLVAGAAYRFVPDWIDKLSPDEEIAVKERTLARYSEEVVASRDMEARLKTLEKAVQEAERGLLDERTPSLAAASVQKILSDITQKSGVVIRTVKVLKPEELPQKGYMSIPVEIAVYANVGQLKEILYRIATDSKLLTVEDLKTTYSTGQGIRTIRCDITVAGYMKTAPV